MTIGRWPEWSTVAARERARELRRDIDEGIDPLSLRETAREAPRVSDMIARYLAEHTPNLAARSAADHHTIMHRLVAPDWGNRLVTEITKADVEKLVTRVRMTLQDVFTGDVRRGRGRDPGDLKHARPESA